jgi:hypothetical protein
MKIINTPPPNYKEIQSHFPDADFNNGVLFTYGDTCYCKDISADLIAHEETHTKQQTAKGMTPKKWWAKYFKDPKFRLDQELEAYKNQWKFIQKHINDRENKARLLHHIGLSLSGKIYGNIITYTEAKNLITK